MLRQHIFPQSIYARRKYAHFFVVEIRFKDHQLRLLGFRFFKSLFQHMRVKKIIRIQKREILTPGEPQSMIARRTSSGVFLADDLHAGIFLRQPLQNSQRAI